MGISSDAYIITAMAAYSNARVAAIVISVLYRMLTLTQWLVKKRKKLTRYYQLIAATSGIPPASDG